MDFVYHLLAIHEEDGVETSVGNVSLAEFTALADKVKALNTQILSSLRNHYPTSDESVTGVCHPPPAVGEPGWYEAADGEHGKAKSAAAAASAAGSAPAGPEAGTMV